ncbi:MAG TPA: oxygen-independent coproporphyrinogen III oxidase [Pseudomonadales bacterium]|nr:oxygen-independent coproporphyrinogen III oxidase [Pseudomonadales bacterium]
MMDNPVFDLNLIKKYNVSGPRYTSYPTALQFTDDFSEHDYRDAIDNSYRKESTLSLYFHLPFCATVCYYCACNKIITKDRSVALLYLDHLHREIEQQGALYDQSRPVTLLHWGGGTPTFISNEQMTELMAQTRAHFNLYSDDGGEYSLEIDPRTVDREKIALLRELGFNRISLGIQDFDPRVQQAVNRIQSEEQTLGVIEAAREDGFLSVSVDLIYGLPHQSTASFAVTLDKINAMSPDRISIYNYAHLPERFKTQRQINAEELPSPAEKLRILELCINQLKSYGYVYIGMDHFAKPEDELAVAQRNGSLQRNFQGYSTHAECDMVAMGITAISNIGATYSQNEKSPDDYYSKIDQGQLPVFQGAVIDRDDQIRKSVIMSLICQFELTFSDIESKYGIDFQQYFQDELQRLSALAEDELLNLDSKQIVVSSRGRLLIRNICMVFDRYLQVPQFSDRFSKVI